MITIHLDTPIPYGEGTLSEITLRKQLSGDLRGIKLRHLFDLDTDALRTVLPRICSPALTPAHIDQLELSDMTEVYGKVVDFFKAPPREIPPESSSAFLTTSAVDGG